jgi:hypothetical protein
MSGDLRFDQLSEEARQRIVYDVLSKQNFTPSPKRKPASESVFLGDQHKVDFNCNALKNRAKRNRRKKRKK